MHGHTVMRRIGSYVVLCLCLAMIVWIAVLAYAEGEDSVVVETEVPTAVAVDPVAADPVSVGTSTAIVTVERTLPAVETIYPNRKIMTIASTTVEASIAKSWVDRIQGLSDTPYLPDNVVKLFVFDAPALHGIWMKDMNYSIDILWVDAQLSIVHIEERISPDTYPASFVPDVPALYVIEAVDGFVKRNGIQVGDSITLPDSL